MAVIEVDSFLHAETYRLLLRHYTTTKSILKDVGWLFLYLIIIFFVLHTDIFSGICSVHL